MRGQGGSREQLELSDSLVGSSCQLVGWSGVRARHVKSLTVGMAVHVHLSGDDVADLRPGGRWSVRREVRSVADHRRERCQVTRWR